MDGDVQPFELSLIFSGYQFGGCPFPCECGLVVGQISFFFFFWWQMSRMCFGSNFVFQLTCLIFCFFKLNGGLHMEVVAPICHIWPSAFSVKLVVLFTVNKIQLLWNNYTRQGTAWNIKGSVILFLYSTTCN